MPTSRCHAHFHVPDCENSQTTSAASVSASRRRRRVRPEWGMGGLHRLLRNLEQAFAQFDKIDTLAQAIGERGDGGMRIVFAPVEAAVDAALERAAQWLKERRHAECGTYQNQRGHLL